MLFQLRHQLGGLIAGRGRRGALRDQLSHRSGCPWRSAACRLDDREDVASRVLEPGDRWPFAAHDALGIGRRAVGAVVALEDDARRGE
jgi:hypothetical protein